MSDRKRLMIGLVTLVVIQIVINCGLVILE